ncbi:MAG: T9SS type A sorting domain-containing protein [Bacteroidales bacterium]|nr:T9SS type A sorting domain-containing protein [Bacteroidales bacterium]
MKHLLQIALVAIFCIWGTNAMAQMSYGGEPYSFKHNEISTIVPEIEFDALDVDALLAEDASIEGKSHALRIGVTIDVNYNINNCGRMDYLPDGSRLWRVAFHMKEATFTSMNFSTFDIPEGAELYFYTPDRDEFIGKFTCLNKMEDGTFYPQEMPGETIILEYYEPANVAFHGNLVIDQLSQGYYDFFHINKDVEGGIGTAEGTCHPNAICYDAQWHAQIQSVVCYTMTSGGYIYMCSGAMVNNTGNTPTNQKHYLLSANHCYEGGTWKFYFGYQATTCNGSNGSIYKTATGYTLKAKDNGDSSSDFMLVEITGTINPIFNVFLAGWDNSATQTASLNAATSCAAIHHPGGDIKKFSIPQTLRNGAQVYSNTTKYWLTTWATATGATEQGSSGSPLFNKDKLIIGQLYAGSSSCSNPGGMDEYGKLSNSWTNGNNSNNAKKLKPWLDPNNSGVTTLQGVWMIGSPDAIANYEGSKSLNVFPNPTSGMVTVSGDFHEGNGVCHVYDMMGNLVWSRTVSLAPEFNINLNSLTAGMYMMEISNAGDVYRSKIIISK